MKKKPTMKRAIIARIISEGKENYTSESQTLYEKLTDSGHLFLVEGLCLIILIRDEVVNIPAVGLHRGDVDILPDGDLTVGWVLF